MREICLIWTHSISLFIMPNKDTATNSFVQDDLPGKKSKFWHQETTESRIAVWRIQSRHQAFKSLPYINFETLFDISYEWNWQHHSYQRPLKRKSVTSETFIADQTSESECFRAHLIANTWLKWCCTLYIWVVT